MWALVAAATLTAVTSDPAAVARQLDDAFAQRTHEGGVRELDDVVSRSVEQAPDSYEVLWRASKAKFWLADSSPEAEKKRRFGKQGWDLAERAIQLEPNRAEAYYYAAINIGAYGEGVGIWQALRQGIEGKFLSRIERALAIDPFAERAGPLVAKGRYFHAMPWPKRDLSRSEALYKKAIGRHPENLRARYYLAQTQLKAGRAKEANETLRGVFEAAVDYDPAEGRRVQTWAKRTQTAIDAELR